MRTITAPGVEWREIDRSGYSPAMTGTGCYVPGFTAKGEPYKPMEFTTRSAWINYYGEPATEAERYSYAAACEVLNQNGRLIFGRLPYDNDAFEKLPGVKYELKRQNDCSMLTSATGIFHQVNVLDSEINNAAVISSNGQPILYDLSAIDEFRTDEAKVAPETFLIVDTTGGTYNKITEDTRKGLDRELIGIIPVVTSPVNAMYAQNYIQLKEKDFHTVSSFETIDFDYLKTLNATDIKSTYTNNGLSCVDVSKRINTHDYYQMISTAISSDVRERVFDANSTQEAVATDITTKTASKATFMGGDASSIVGISAVVSSLVSCYVEDSIAAGSEWKTLLDATPQTDTSNKILWKCVVKYEYKLSEDDPRYGWHNPDGDDSIPDTLALDANNYFSTIQPAADGEGFDPEHLKDIGVVVYKAFLDPSEGNKVSYELVEAFCGSLYKDDKDPNTGVSKFIDTIINTNSQYINFFSNCFASKTAQKWYAEDCDIIIAKPSQGCILGLYSDMTTKYISVNKSIYDALNKSFEKVSNILEKQIDIVCDAGIANIASYIKAIYGDKGQYDMSVVDDLGNSLLTMWKVDNPTNSAVKTWKTVEQKFDNFCKNVRKDCMVIADGLRPLVLQGQKKIIRDSKPANTIDVNILPYVKSVTGLNSSYVAVYIDWFEQADDYTGDFFWCPPSIKAMGVYINTDVNYNYWDAPAGLNRGRIPCSDVAFNPSIKQAGLIYEKCLNYAINYPQDGIVLEGQRTTQVKPSAFDRVNVRRLFLRLERMSFFAARYFVYEGNNAYNRQRLIDAIDPYFKEAKIGGGVYDYKIICDESINTPEVIDRNEMHCKIGIKPTKTAEFIMLDFIALPTGGSFSELMG